MELIKKPNFSKTILIVFIALFVVTGAYIVYRMLAATTADLMDGSVIVSSVKNVDRVTPISNYDKAVEISKKMYPNGSAPAVVVAANGNNPESLQAGLIASAEKAPLLYSNNTSIPAVISAEIKRLNPQKIYVVASSSVLSSTQDTAVKNLVPTATFERITGTSAQNLAKNVGIKLIALNGGTLADGTVIVTNPASTNIETVGYFAGIKKYPVLYATTTLPADTSSFITTYKPTKTIISGNTGSVPDAVTTTFPGKYRIAGTDRYTQAINLYKYARTSGAIDFSEIAIVSELNYPSAILSGPYMALSKKGVLIDAFVSNATTLNYVKLLGTSYGLTKIHLVSDDVNLSNANMMKYANAIGSNYTSAQLSLQAMVDTRIKMCPQLTGVTADYGDTQGYQAISYYSSGKILVNTSHSATLDGIINHEIYHVIDWRDNSHIDWGESIPRATPDCTP